MTQAFQLNVVFFQIVKNRNIPLAWQKIKPMVDTSLSTNKHSNDSKNNSCPVKYK